MDTNHEPKVVELKLVLSKHQQKELKITNEKILKMYRTEKFAKKRKMEVRYGLVDDISARIKERYSKFYNIHGTNIRVRFNESFATVNNFFIRNDELFVELELNPNFDQDTNFLGYVKGMYWKSNLDYGTILETTHWEGTIGDKEDMFNIETLEAWAFVCDSNTSGYYIINFGIRKKIVYEELIELAKLHNVEYE